MKSEHLEMVNHMVKTLNEIFINQEKTNAYLAQIRTSIDEKNYSQVNQLLDKVKEENLSYLTCVQSILYQVLGHTNLEAIQYGFQNNWFREINWNERVSPMTRATPLYYILCSSEESAIEIAKLFIEKGASINNLVYHQESKRIKNYFTKDYALTPSFTFSDLVQFEISLKEKRKLEKKLKSSNYEKLKLKI